VALVGVLSLAEPLFGLDLGIDRLLLVTPHALDIGGARVRMSPIAAVVFVLLGCALALIDWRTSRKDWPAQFLSFVAAIGVAFGLVGVVLSPAMSPITLAWPAVVSYFGLAFGIVCARAPWAIGGLLTSNTQGARLLRRSVPIGLLILSLIGWLISKPLLTESHFTWVEVSALAVVCSATLASFIAWVAFIVNRGETERKKLEQALHGTKEHVDQLLDRIEEPQAEAKLRSKVTVGFALAIFLTCLLSFFSWRMAQQATDDAVWVAHTHEVLTTLESALRHLIDVETGGRGFALTGREPFLEPYQAGKVATLQDLHSLRLLMADNAAQLQRLEVLEARVNARIEAATNIVTIRRKTGESPAEAQLERGKQLMDAARAMIAEMENVERSLLEQRGRRAHAAQRFNLSLIGLGSIVGVMFLLVAGATISREIGISARARAQVISLNADLERRVEQRTAALGESEGRLAGVIQSAMDSIITVDDEQRIVLFNSAAEKVFRCLAAEAIRQPISRFIPKRFHGVHEGHIRRFGETGVTSRAMGPKDVLWAVRADGQEFPIEASISQVVTGGRKLFTVILRDVTERTQAEAMRERLAAIVESSDDAIISKRLDGTITAWNHGAEKVFGHPASEAVGKKMWMIIPTERANEEIDILARIARGESVEHFETVRVRKDGKPIDVSVTISPIRDSNGVVVGASKIARDITERKRTAAALAEQTLMLKLVLDNMGEGLVAADREGHFLIWNETAKKLMGREAADLPSEQWNTYYQVFLPDGVTPYPGDSLPLVRALRGESVQAELIVGRPELNSKVWLEVTARPMKDAQGKSCGGVAVLRDITERKHAQESLRRSDAGRVVALEAASLGEWEIDLETNQTRRSRRHDRIFGYDSSPEWSPEMFFQHVHPDDRPRARRNLEAAVSQGVKLETECRIIRPDGEIRWIRACGDLYRDSAGNSTRMFGTVEDISERKRQEAELRESEQRFQAMANGIPQLAWMAEADGHIFWYNQRWYDYTGTTFEQMEGWAWQTVHDPDMLPKVLEGWKGSIATGDPFDMEFPLRGADGVFRTFLTRVVPVKDPDGRVIRWFGTNTDISERKTIEEKLAGQTEELTRQAEELIRSQQALEAQKLMLQSVLDSMEEGLVVADEQGKFIIWNPAAARIVGLGGANVPPEEWGSYYGTYLPDTITPFPTDQNPLVRAIRGEVCSTEIFIRNPKLEQGVWIESNGAPLRDKSGTLRGGVVAFRDITEKKAADLEIRKLNETLEERIAQRTAQLESTNRELESFTYSVSHDLRAPLRHIGSFAGACLEEFGPTLDPQALHYVQRIQEGARRMGVLTDELLNLSRTGQRSLHLQLTALNSIVEEIMSMLKTETDGREVEWKIGNLPSVECDPALVRQVFQNLLSNAIKYSRRRPHAVIEVGHTQESGQQVIFVRDNGAGFNMQYADKLFGVFQRLHRQEEFEGTGVGLATVHRIVQKHGGRIWAEAELDRGATFYFTLGGNQVAGSQSDAAKAGA
jgi:PAS domain S-box-containing protein